MRTLLTISLVLIVSAASGCGFGPPDPLLYDADGMNLASVTIDEVDGAGIPSCADVDTFDPSDVEVVVPIVGTGGEPVLIGIGGQAFCVAGDGDDGLEGLDDADDFDIGDAVGPDENEPVDLRETEPGEGSHITGSIVHPIGDQQDDGIGHGPTPRPGILLDPTPEPAID
jgi:hypothetical protein